MPATKGPTLSMSAADSHCCDLPGVGTWQYDAGNDSFTGSSECCALRGIQPSANPGGYKAVEWNNGIHYADRKRVEAEFERLLLAEKTHISLRYRIWSNTAHWCWVLTRAQIVEFGSDNHPLKISGVDINVAEIYEELPENKRLREEAERSEIALASAEQGLWHADIRSGVRTENDTWRTMRGYPADSSYNSIEDWERDIHPDDYALVMNRNNIRDDQKSDRLDYTYRQRHANGEWRWIWSRGKIIERDLENKPTVFIGTDTDITHIKEAETRYERLSNTLEVAMQTAGMGVWEWTLNAQVNVWDRRTLEIFGADPDSRLVPHTKFLSMVHPEDRAELEGLLNEAVADRQDINVEYRIIHPQKGIRNIQAKATCHFSVEEFPRYVGIVWDVTDTVEAEKERITLAENLSHAQRLQSIGELTGGIAHDINNVLAIISGNAELMSLTVHKDNQFLGAILSASRRGAELTQGLLAFSRKQSLQPVSVNLQVLTDNLEAMLGRTLGSTITLESRISECLWSCLADRAQLENALVNLIVNARDAMPNGGTITVKVENTIVDDSLVSLTQNSTPGDFLKISVADTGTGMSRQVLTKSIDPFFTTKKVGEGHGLGLSMVFGFVKQSNGHMTIESIEGQGTTINLYLPRFRGVSQNKALQSQGLEPLPMGNGETILLVEDEIAVQEMVTKTIEFLGYRTVCASEGSEALRTMAQYGNTINLMVSDIVLAGAMNGLELGAQVRQQYPDTRILYMSGYAQDVLQQRDSPDESLDVLHKPFSVEKLARRIAKQLEA